MMPSQRNYNLGADAPPSNAGLPQSRKSVAFEPDWGERIKIVLWRFRFSITFLILYSIFQWGFAHMSFSQGFFESPENPNYVVLALGGLTFFMRFAVYFAVPAHITYRVVELILEFAVSLQRPKRL